VKQAYLTRMLNKNLTVTSFALQAFSAERKLQLAILFVLILNADPPTLNLSAAK
jgi:hypothetical protein